MTKTKNNFIKMKKILNCWTKNILKKIFSINLGDRCPNVNGSVEFFI